MLQVKDKYFMNFSYILQKSKFVWRLLVVLRDFLFCFFVGVKWDISWRFYGLPHIQQRKFGSIVIGKRFVAISKARFNSIGLFQPVILKCLSPDAKIVIGSDTGLSGCTLSARKSILVGSHVLIGSGVLIVDHDAHPLSSQSRREKNNSGECCEVVIEDDVFIGARAIILKGVRVGKGAIVGAGAVVSRSVPEYKIVAGNPACVVGDAC